MSDVTPAGSATDPPGGRRSLRRSLRRLPLRLRLVAGFAAAMVFVLTGSGAFVYWRVEYALDRRLDTDLTGQADALQRILDATGALPAGGVVDVALAQYQVVEPSGEVAGSGTGLGSRPVLPGASLQQARRRPVTVDVGSLLPISARPLRVLAQPLRADPSKVLVVAVSRAERDEALRELIGQLFLAGFGTLVVSTVVGERLAEAALRPVERYRSRAQSIAAGATGVRLDVPAGRDDEVTRLGTTLNEMLAELENSLERERRFVDDASHELRTPLTVMLTRVELALRRPRSPSEHEAVLQELHGDLQQLAALAEALLTLGASGRPDGPVGPLDGADIAATLRSLAAPGVVGGGAASWTLSGADREALVAMPELAQRQVLTNLLTNAHVHGVDPVDVTLRRANGVVVVGVTDGGAGLPPEFLPRAVERFSRTADARARPGAGLGLSLVHSLVLAAGGELRLCSGGAHHRYEQRFDVPCEHPLQGLTASMLLPLRPGALHDSLVEPAPVR